MAFVHIGRWCYDESWNWPYRGQAFGLGYYVMTIAAKYEEGVFKPLEEVAIEEGTVVEVRLPTCADGLNAKSPFVRDFALYGIWRDCDDIGDSVEYVNNLRRDLHG
jgi:hypothetical protein